MRLSELLEGNKYADKRTEKAAYGNLYIYNPDIMDVERGNMVRVHGHAKHPNFEPDEGQNSWGIIVLDVDYKKGMVLVGEYIGGSKRFAEWVPLDQIDVTWNIGGYDRAMELMDAFEKDLKKSLNDRDTEEIMTKHLLKPKK